MTQLQSRTRLAAAAAAAALLLCGGPALAQDDEVDRQFSAQIGELALKAQEQRNEDDLLGALDTIARAMDRNTSEYERYQLLFLRGVVNYDLERTDAAISDWQDALAVGVATPDEASDLQSRIGQVQILDGRFEAGVATLEAWLDANPPSEPILTMLARALAEMEQYDRALPYAERAFELAETKERKHFDLLNYLYDSTDMPDAQAELLAQMLERWPDDRNLWNGWASMLSRADRTREAFEVNRLMYVNGMLTSEADLKRLVQYYSYFEVPFRGAQIWEREMNSGRVASTEDNTRLLIDLWRQAREFDRAIPVLQMAAAASPEGQLYEQLCEAYAAEGMYAEAESACEAALDKGGLEEPGADWMLIGNARYEQGRRDEALEAFTRGLDFAHSRSDAQDWIDFINGEVEREEANRQINETIRREGCILTIERIRRDALLGDRAVPIPEECQPYEDLAD